MGLSLVRRATKVLMHEIMFSYHSQTEERRQQSNQVLQLTREEEDLLLDSSQI